MSEQEFNSVNKVTSLAGTKPTSSDRVVGGVQ